MSPKDENIKEKAMLFACYAHQGQVRKSEKEKPMIIHPLETGMILEKYGFDENVVAAGFLHDVIEDTKYTKEDIMKLFGEDICTLVCAASESDKSKSWEQRKLETIRKVRGYDERKKAVVAADKISNLQSLKNLFERTGKRDFSCFKRGENQQSWYYTVLHRSLVFSDREENTKLYDEMKELVESIFYSKLSNEEIEASIFVENAGRLEKLKKLNARVDELAKLNSLNIVPKKPIVIEFLGTMRAGKTTAIRMTEELFKKKGFNVKVVEEFTTSEKYKEEIRPKFNGTLFELHNIIIDNVCSKIEEVRNDTNYDIVLVDRGLNDRLIWLLRLYFTENKITKKQYEEIVSKCKEKADSLTDIIASFKVSSARAMKRDYNSSLSLDKRHFMNIDNINQYNSSMTVAMFELFNPSLKIIPINTDDVEMIDANIECASEIISVIRQKLISEIHKKTDEMAKEYIVKYGKC